MAGRWRTVDIFRANADAGISGIGIKHGTRRSLRIRDGYAGLPVTQSVFLRIFSFLSTKLTDSAAAAELS